ncbi:hypothetical protein BpHYR1_032582 [Brachionus plicatilis]|uniref:Uncharacterized protein n=1 Tax=Brachionus plicatilis TaxID=10195 RepID=A0A3M7PGG5_BRAPC|nr:hypothetical protein BpHYR1_032582 [Brachionus plicatilis]
MRRDLTNVDHIKIEYDTKRDDLFVVTISNKKVNFISYNLNEINPAISNQYVDLSQLLIESHHLNINQFTISFNKKLLVYTHDQSLYYFDTTNGKLLNSKSFREQSMNIDYFLNPTSLSLCYFKNLAPVEKSDNLILLDNIGNIYFVHYLVETNEIRSFRTKNFIFDSFTINKDKLLACDLVNFKLVCFDLAKAEQNLSFHGSFFAIDFEKSKNLQHYGLSTSNKNVYLIENKKNLRFFDLFDLINGEKLKVKQTANLVLYAEVTSVLCSDEFISLSMKDKKVVSFLISDKKNLEKTRSRIKNLPIFGIQDKELVRKNKLIVDYCVNSLDSDSDDDYIDTEQYFDEKYKFSNEKDIKLKKRFKQNSILVEPTKLECKIMNCLDLKNNWQEDILTKEEEEGSITESDLHHKESLLKILRENSDKSAIKNNRFNTSIDKNFSSTACKIQ